MEHDQEQRWFDKAYIRERTRTAEPCLYCSPSGRILSATPPVKKLVEEDVVGRNLNDLLEDRLAARIIAGGVEGRDTETRCTIRGGQYVVRACPWEDGPGIELVLEPLGAREEQRWNDANQSLLIAREINLGLSGMLAVTDSLDGSQTPEQLEKSKCRIRQGIYRMIRLSRSLQDSAELEQGLITPSYSQVDMRAFCADLMTQMEPICQKAGIDLQWTLPERPLSCRVDPDLVHQMVCHLVSNAIKAQPQGGAIRFKLESRDSQMSLTVSDHGKSAASVPDSAFRSQSPEALLTRPGLHLGLPLTRAFAELHGGRLLLVAGEGGGVTAKILLPLGNENRLDPLHDQSFQYGVGIDPLLVNLSTVADAGFYEKKS